MLFEHMYWTVLFRMYCVLSYFVWLLLHLYLLHSALVCIQELLTYLLQTMRQYGNVFGKALFAYMRIQHKPQSRTIQLCWRE